MAQNQEQDKDFQPVSITLPEKYWVVVLNLVERAMEQTVAPRLAELQRQKATPKDLSPEEMTILMDVLTARAQIVDQLVERGVLKEEVRERLGIDKFFNQVAEANKQAKNKDDTHDDASS